LAAGRDRDRRGGARRRAARGPAQRRLRGRAAHRAAGARAPSRAPAPRRALRHHGARARAAPARGRARGRRAPVRGRAVSRVLIAAALLLAPVPAQDWLQSDADASVQVRALPVTGSRRGGLGYLLVEATNGSGDAHTLRVGYDSSSWAGISIRSWR